MRKLVILANALVRDDPLLVATPPPPRGMKSRWRADAPSAAVPQHQDHDPGSSNANDPEAPKPPAPITETR